MWLHFLRKGWLASPVRLATTACAIVTVGWLAVTGGPAKADMFKIDSLDVDVESTDAVAARAEAIQDAERRGLRLLLERLTASVDHGRLPDTSTISTEPYIRSFDIDQEQLSATRYVALINVAYQEQAVSELLSASGIAHVAVRRPDILVIPAMQEIGYVNLAGQQTPWYQIWQRVANSGGTVGWRLASYNDSAVRALAGADSALQPQMAVELAESYGVTEIVLALAEEGTTGGIRYSLSGLHGIGLDRSGFLIDNTVIEQGHAMRRILDELTTSQAAAWKAENLLRNDKVNQIGIAVSIADFSDWVQVSRSLDRLTVVREIAVDTFSRAHAELTVAYVGERADLDNALGARGWVLIKESEALQESSLWQLRRAAGLQGNAGG